MAQKTGFRKVKFHAAVELAGRGFSPVGGADSDGVYSSVPAELTEGWHFDALVSDGTVELLGEGVPEDDSGDMIPADQAAVFKASGMSQADWLALAPVERDARAQVHAQEVAKVRADEAEKLMAIAGKTNAADAVMRQKKADFDKAEAEKVAKAKADAADPAAFVPTDKTVGVNTMASAALTSGLANTPLDDGGITSKPTAAPVVKEVAKPAAKHAAKKAAKK